MMSLVILLTVLVPTTLLIDNVVSQATQQRAKVAATELADEYLEQTANATLASLEADISRDVLLTATPVTVAGLQFNVWSHLEWADTGASTHSLCTTGNPPQVIRATITVKWAGGQQLGETSIINPPYGALIPNDGFLSIQIEGATGSAPADTANLVNVPVTVTPSSGSAVTYNPDQYGCVYLEEPLGTYTVSLGSPSSGPTFIDWQENLTPSQASISVPTAGLPTFVTFHYDEAATVSFTPGGSAPAATGMPISVADGGSLQPEGIATVVAAGSASTSAQLFPYTSDYTVWYGDCGTISGVTEEQPAVPTDVAVTPNSTSSVTINGLDTLALTITRSSGNFSAAPSATATVRDSAAPGDGCPANDEPTASAPEIYGLAASTGSANVYTDQTGILAQTYTVKITDPTNASTTSFAMTVGASGVTYNSTLYPYGTPVPVTVP
jgi:hypothetical protein